MATQPVLFNSYKIVSKKVAQQMASEFINQNYVLKVDPAGTFITDNGTIQLYNVYSILGKILITDASGACTLGYTDACEPAPTTTTTTTSIMM